ncbi:MAG: hypothetical protein QM699_11950 [Amaricoccus sp.]
MEIARILGALVPLLVRVVADLGLHPVDDVRLQRGIDLAERDRLRQRAERLHRRENHRVRRCADLLALDVRRRGHRGRNGRELPEARVERAEHDEAVCRAGVEGLLADRAVEEGMGRRRVGEEEGQRHDVELRVDGIGHAAEADVDRAGANAVGDRSLVAELPVWKDLHRQRPAGPGRDAVGEAGDRLLDQAAGA